MLVEVSFDVNVYMQCVVFEENIVSKLRRNSTIQTTVRSADLKPRIPHTHTHTLGGLLLIRGLSGGYRNGEKFVPKRQISLLDMAAPRPPLGDGGVKPPQPGSGGLGAVSPPTRGKGGLLDKLWGG